MDSQGELSARMIAPRDKSIPARYTPTVMQIGHNRYHPLEPNDRNRREDIARCNQRSRHAERDGYVDSLQKRHQPGEFRSPG